MTERLTAARLVTRLRELRTRSPGTVLVGIDGCGGAGKSALADRVAAGVPSATVVRTDDFARPDVDGWDVARFVEEVLAPLAAGRDARYRLRPWDASGFTGWATVPAGGIVVVEGVSATRREVGDVWALRVWVDTPEPVRAARIRARDGDALLDRWRAEWWPSEQAYLADQHPERSADVVVDGSAPFG